MSIRLVNYEINKLAENIGFINDFHIITRSIGLINK